MSVIPPDAVILSKLKYYIKSKVSDETKQTELLTTLGSWPEFKLEATFRKGYEPDETQLDVPTLIEKEVNLFDCVDVVKYAFTKLKKEAMLLIKDKGTLKVMLKFKMPEDTNWTDLFKDELPINWTGVTAV